MSSRPPPARKSPSPARAPSGTHPAVQAYRDKLESIVENTGSDVADLDRKLADYLESVRTPVPPAPPPDGEAETKDPT